MIWGGNERMIHYNKQFKKLMIGRSRRESKGHFILDLMKEKKAIN
jgi:hypothetical protein